MDGSSVMDPVRELLEEYHAALQEAARLEAEIENAEHLRKVIIADESPKDLPEWKADARARTTQRYIDHLAEIHRLKLAAGAARAKADYLELRLGVWRTREAGRRTQQRGD